MKTRYMYLLMLPGILFLTVFMIIPIVLTIGTTFTDGSGITLDGYLTFLKDRYFLDILFTTLRVSLLTTLICIILGFPAAYYISKLGGRMKAVLLLLTIFPLLTSSVVRSFSWMIIIGRNGLLNKMLLGMGIIHEPLDILYTPTAIIIGLVHLFLPLIIVSLVGVMENIQHDLLEAAESLGASKATVFLKVVLPLCVPGLVIGSILVFVGSFTAYTTPALLGGKQRVISTFLYQNAITLNDWQVASIVATIMIVITFAVIACMNALARKLNPKG
ncbi:ABC transporter permease [Rossellomorea marisflavi]|jgi:putative spermidine/putrescine transport system permease protein|uniref:Spermidine/putrescine ABC transporter permease n=1 Tax=Rossellomorea marisflavi TaxID=189381 RepID=A0A0J5S583_9BACI|nr:ABC transporter permease [Rossellomorea marisflavi]KMK90377.1 spermidine/putrescine ABC transporter permease [Rossellomorea marisflavi]KML08106.1 spermidine/putrescine ABC transporter permease [Rossellomorea marisflavi]KML34561.1 spermidine/putrescine ABC transporter permease [Rossellomorea marisflavi]KZE47253.1 spermidine/putrescine ABC transporter permease [Rossellomorea marisflavi]MDR4938608.1 ABC transporter permease [Rossellomorea marisflavi]